MLKRGAQDNKSLDDVPLMQRRMKPKMLEVYSEQNNSME
jgi:hypothetical protein